jgi:DNA-binding transcriptional LysR family regulator
MIAVRIGPDLRLVPVASPAYFRRHPVPATPQELVAQSCINLRLVRSGVLYAWEFERDNRPMRVRVGGQLTVSSIKLAVSAALEGYGIAFVPEPAVAGLVAEGRLVQVLDAWCQPTPGFHLYYPNRRQNSAAFQVVAEMLRQRG